MNRSITALLLAVLLCGSARDSSGLAARHPRAGAPSPAAGARNPSPAAHFQVGEKLDYTVAWMSLTSAATVELSVAQRQRFFGADGWHFEAVVHSENLLRYLMVLDDQFDSYAADTTLATRQYELYLNEHGKRSTERFRLSGTERGAVRVAAPPETRDPLAALYELRSVVWQRTPEFHSPIFDGTHFYRMDARLAAAHEAVTVPAGKFDASRIALLVNSTDQQASPIQVTLWLANNWQRTPLRVDASLPLGTLQAELVRAQEP